MSTWIKDFWKRIKKTTGQTDSVCADADGVHQWEKWKTLGVYNLISEADAVVGKLHFQSRTCRCCGFTEWKYSKFRL